MPRHWEMFGSQPRSKRWYSTQSQVDSELDLPESKMHTGPIRIHNRYNATSPLEVYHKSALDAKSSERQKATQMLKRRLEGRYLVRSVMHARKEQAKLQERKRGPMSHTRGLLFSGNKRSSIPTYAYEEQVAAGREAVRQMQTQTQRRQSLSNETTSPRGGQALGQSHHTEKIYKSQLGKLHVENLFSKSTANSSRPSRKLNSRSTCKTSLQLYQAYQADPSNRTKSYLASSGVYPNPVAIYSHKDIPRARSCFRETVHKRQLSPTQLPKSRPRPAARPHAPFLYPTDWVSAKQLRLQEGYKSGQQEQEAVSSEYLAMGHNARKGRAQGARHIKSLSWKCPSPPIRSTVPTNEESGKKQERSGDSALDIRTAHNSFVLPELGETANNSKGSVEDIHYYFVALHHKARQMVQPVERSNRLDSQPHAIPQRTVTSLKDDDPEVNP